MGKWFFLVETESHSRVVCRAEPEHPSLCTCVGRTVIS